MTLTVQNGSFSYKKGTALLENISLEAERGDVLAILGPNGAGKTTLLRCMLNLCRWKKGQTLLDGRDVRAIPARTLWQMISYVPQAKTAASSCTVEQMVLLGRSSHIAAFSAPTQKDLQQTHDAMDRLGLSSFTDRRCCELSGGELQMVMLARALVSGPKLLILDEPESNLDMKNQLRVLDAISYINQEKNTACVINTHFPAHALQLSDKTLLLGQNYRQKFGDTAEIITENNVEEFFQTHARILDFSAEGRTSRTIAPYRIADNDRKEEKERGEK